VVHLKVVSIEFMKNSKKVKYKKIVQKPALFLRAVVRKMVPEAVRPNISTIAKYLCIGLAIRFLLMPIASLPHDAISINFIAYVTEHYGLFNYFLYYVSPSPPLLTYMLAPFFKFYEFFQPGFFFQKYIIHAPQSYPMLYAGFPGENYPYYQILMSDPQIFTLLFLGKLPGLIFDIALGFMLLRIFKDPRKSLLAFKIWLLNPITLYVIYVMGEIEIIPVFFAVYGAYKIYVNKPRAGFLFLGLAAAMKPMALLLIPLAYLVSSKNKTIAQRITYLVMGILPLSLELGFVSLVSLLHKGYQLVIYEGLTQRYPSSIAVWLRTAVDYSAHVLTFDQFIDIIYFFPLIYALILVLTAFSPRITNTTVWELFTLMFSVMFAFNLFHPHWFLWYGAFAVIFVVKAADKRLLYLFYLIFLFFVVYTFYWGTLQLALFMPLMPTAYNLPSALGLLQGAGLPAVQLINVARSAFSGFLIFFAILSLKYAYFGKQSVSDVIQTLKNKVENQPQNK